MEEASAIRRCYAGVVLARRYAVAVMSFAACRRRSRRAAAAYARWRRFDIDAD